MSSLITSSFSKDSSYVAYVIQSLDHQVLKIQSTTDNLTDILVYPLTDSTLKVNHLLFIDNSSLILTYFNKPFFQVFSTKLNKVLQTLKINSNKISTINSNSENNKIFLIDSNNYLYNFNKSENGSEDEIWELNDRFLIESSDSFSQLLQINDSSLAIVSNSIYLLNLNTKKIEKSLNLFINLSNCLKIFKEKYVFVSSTNDRFINCIDLVSFKIVKIFVNQSSVTSFSIINYKKNFEILISLNENGSIEIFNDPLNIKNNLTEDSNNNSKKRKKLVKSIKSNSKISLFRKNNELLKIDSMSTNFNQIVYCWLENSSFFGIDKISWLNNENNDYSFGDDDDVKLFKNFNSLNINSHVFKGSDKSSINKYSEGDTIIGSGNNFKDIESNSEEEEEEEEDNVDFGSLTEKYKVDLNAKKGKFQVGTLTTVLSQSLKNNDNSLFDNILNNNKDEKIIKETIIRLDSIYILKLLDKLSEKLARNKFKNKQEVIDIWIKNILIFHGNYLNSLTNVKSKLNLINISMDLKAKNLSKLFELRGKIGIVTEKLELEKEIRNFELNNKFDSNEDNESEVEYIEELDGYESDEDSDINEDELEVELENDEIIEEDEEEEEEEEGDEYEE